MAHTQKHKPAICANNEAKLAERTTKHGNAAHGGLSGVFDARKDHQEGVKQ